MQAVLAFYALMPGDTVVIDTGTYNLTNSIVVGVSGTSNAPVVFLGSPNGVTINRGNAGYNVWDLNANYVAICTAISSNHPAVPKSWMKITGGSYGINVNAIGCKLSGLEVCNNQIGMFPQYGTVIENCLIRSNVSAGIFFYFWGSGSVVSNCTITGNGSYQIYTGQSGVMLGNNIILANGANNYCVYENYALAESDYNLFFATNGAAVGYSGGIRATLTDWRSATDQDMNSQAADPLFVNAAGGDYHLQSTASSYHNGAWTADAANSPGIDMGNPSSSWTNEPMPNGSRVNLGAYGNTAQASKTPASSLPILWVTPTNLSFGSVMVNTTNQLVFTVQNSGGGSLTGNVDGVSVPFLVVGGTNYILGSGATTNVTLRFAPMADGTYSNNVVFNSGAGNLLRPVTGTATSPPSGVVQFAENAYSIPENAGAVTVLVSRVGGSFGSVSATYATSNGTASAELDYMATNGTLSWANGDIANRPIVVLILNETTYESNETFIVRLSGTTLGSPTSTVVTIVNDDPGPLPEVFGDASFGVMSNRFGFNINWESGRVVVVDANTNLNTTNWIPLTTGTLSGVPYYFFDSKWTNYIGRFYRIRSP